MTVELTHFDALLPCLCGQEPRRLTLTREYRCWQSEQFNEGRPFSAWRVHCGRCDHESPVAGGDAIDAVKRWNDDVHARARREEERLETKARHPALQGDGSFDIGGGG